jgi:hypothetical protein
LIRGKIKKSGESESCVIRKGISADPRRAHADKKGIKKMEYGGTKKKKQKTKQDGACVCARA